jgi:VIT1/CCC1 family predicted Fe2+/Mn2+ transporter
VPPSESREPHAGTPVSGALLPDSTRLIEPVDRISEILFGLIMAATIIGSMSVATAGRQEVREVLVAALGCNLAWGLVDALMYLMRVLTERSRLGVLARHIRGADAATARRLIVATLPPHVAAIAGDDEVEGMRRRVAAASALPPAGLRGEDYLAALGIFLLVVGATFPVVLPFLLASDATVAMKISRVITLAMLFGAGLALGRYAGHPRSLLTGVAMLLLGAVVIGAVMALGG